MRTVVFNSIFDIYPNKIQDQEAVIGYRIPGKRTRLSFPFSLKIRKKIQPDFKGRYRASDIGLEPVIIKQNHASKFNVFKPRDAWFGNYLWFKDIAANDSLERIAFVDKVDFIGPNAFGLFKNLKEIILPDAPIFVHAQAFGDDEEFKSLMGKINVHASVPSKIIFDNLMSRRHDIEDFPTYYYTGTYQQFNEYVAVQKEKPKYIRYLNQTVCADGEPVFFFVRKIEDRVVLEGLTLYGEQQRSLIIPDWIDSISPGVFKNDEALESIVLPQKLQEIGREAFAGCTSLKSIRIPDGIEVIQTHTFLNCDSLENIQIPEGVVKIDSYAFEGCDNLVAVAIPSSVVEFGQDIFTSCSNLRRIYYNGTGVIPRTRRSLWRCTINFGGVLPLGNAPISKQDAV